MKKFFEILVCDSLPNGCELIPITDEKGISGYMGKGLGTWLGFQFNTKYWQQPDAEQWVKEKTEKRTFINKVFESEYKTFNDEELSFEGIASNEEIDRDGDILRAKGWQLKNFKKNPVMLWGHDGRSFPIGKIENIRVEGTELKFKAVFVPEDISPIGKMIYSMYKQKFLNAFSVRFDPFKFEKRDPSEDEIKNGIRFGTEYLKQDLLEISGVTIPSLASALVSRDFQSMLIKSMQIKNAGLIEDETERKEMLEKEVKICVGCGVCKSTELTLKELKEVIGDYTIEEIVEVIKAGRVLSAKNRTLIKTAMESIGTVMTSFQALLEATQEDPKGADAELDKLKEDLKKFSEIDDVDGFIQSAKERLNNIEGGN